MKFDLSAYSRFYNTCIYKLNICKVFLDTTFINIQKYMSVMASFFVD